MSKSCSCCEPCDGGHLILSLEMSSVELVEA